MLQNAASSNSKRKRIQDGDQTDSGSDSDVLDLSQVRTHTTKTDDIACVDEDEQLLPAESESSDDETSSKKPTEDHISLSSASETDEPKEDEDQNASRRHRRIISDDQLAKTTKEAEKEETQRMERLKEKQDSVTQLTQSRPELQNKFVLDFDTVDKKPVVVHDIIASKLKDHQKEGIQFMYESCYGDINTIDKNPGSGCILAHCMGLGKTLQLIALLHTLISYPKLKTKRVLVLCPKSTVLNWVDELKNWLKGVKDSPTKITVAHFEDNDKIDVKCRKLEQWFNLKYNAGCLLLGYEAFRTLVNYSTSKKNQAVSEKLAQSYQSVIDRCLLDPGADLVVCDEGHAIKNSKSAINKAVCQINTRRRIILTGTPIQNNLTEYYWMVNFVKPQLLGTEKEFNNRYANPIKQGQCKDSTDQEIRNMKRRAFILHKKLENTVQRKEASVLKEFLPEKYEYVLFIPLTACQEKLYDIFLNRCTMGGKNGGKTLLPDYTFLRKIWTHPKVLEVAWMDAKKNKDRKETKDLEKNLKKIVANNDDEDIPDDVFDIGTGKLKFKV